MYTKREVCFYNGSMCLFSTAILMQSLDCVNLLLEHAPNVLLLVISVILCISITACMIWMRVKNKPLYHSLYTARKSGEEMERYRKFPQWAEKYRKFSIWFVLATSIVTLVAVIL